MPKSAISTVLILLIKSWLMPDYLLLHTSQDNLMAHTPTWKSVVPDIYDMPYTTQPNMSVTGIQHSLNIWQETSRRQTLQCCHISCRQKVGSSYLPSRENQPAIHQSCLSFSNSILLFLSTSNDALFVMQFSRFKEL